MSANKLIKNTTNEKEEGKYALPRQNVYFLLIGLAVVVVGFLFLLGGKAQDPNDFDAKVIFSFPRMVIAPLLICAGFAFEVVAIMKINKK